MAIDQAPTDQAPKTQAPCPSCGGLLLQANLPECPYCGHGLGGPALERNPLGDRLAKMSDHEVFAGLMRQSPMGDDHSRASQRAVTGGVLLLLGGAIRPSAWGSWQLLRLIPAAVVIALGLSYVITGLSRRGAPSKGKLYRRPAIVIDRRSETAFNGWSGRVTYFFTLEFEDGSQGEFRFPGRGWPHEPLARGATGLAFTRGANLLEFTNLKV